MMKLKSLVLVSLSLCGMGLAVPALAATIDISTGVAAWQVYVPYPGPGFTAATNVSPNGTWAPAPAGSSWVSYNANQSTSCVVGQTPGNGCANTLLNPNGDIWTYQLTVSAASLGATSGSLNAVFGADNNVHLFLGNSPFGQDWNGYSGDGFNPLGCTGPSGPTSAGNTQATYNLCTGTQTFDASYLNGDGSLTLTAYVYNNPIPGCPACGDPTGFVLEGSLLSGVAVPLPASAWLLLSGLVGMMLLRRRAVAI